VDSIKNTKKSKIDHESSVIGDDVLMSAAFVACGALVSLAFSSPIGALVGTLGGAVIRGVVYLTGKPKK
jgi:hypothetical protein